MQLKNKFFSVLAVAIGIVGFSTFTLAQDQSSASAPEKSEAHRHHGGKGGDGMRHGGGDFMRAFHDLDLTDAQKTQIRSIMDANKPDQAAMDEMRTLREAKQAGTLTADQQARMQTLRTERMEKGKAIHAQIRAILTPEQQAKLDARQKEMQQKWGDRRQRRGQDPAAGQSDQPADQ